MWAISILRLRDTQVLKSNQIQFGNILETKTLIAIRREPNGLNFQCFYVKPPALHKQSTHCTALAHLRPKSTWVHDLLIAANVEQRINIVRLGNISLSAAVLLGILPRLPFTFAIYLQPALISWGTLNSQELTLTLCWSSKAPWYFSFSLYV